MLVPQTASAAGVPHLINYQGRIATGGVNFDGSGQFKFALVGGASNTDIYWTSSPDTAPQDGQPDLAVTLTVTKGLYSVMLGNTALTNMAAIPSTVFTHDDVHLRVWFNDGSHGWQTLSPDQRIAAVGYALMSETVPDGAITAGKIAPGAVTSAALAPGSVSGSSIAPGSIQLSQLDPTSINATTLGTQAVVDASIAATLGNSGGMASLKSILAEGHVSTSIAIVSDSTNANEAWSGSFIRSVGALYPAYTVKTIDWVPPGGPLWDPPVTVQQGIDPANPGVPAAERHWEFPAGCQSSPVGYATDFPMPAGDLDIRARVRIGNASASANLLFSKADYPAKFGFRFWQGDASQSRPLLIDYSADGDAYVTLTSTAGLATNGIVDGTPYWARATIQADPDSGGKKVTFYTSTDGRTWTQLGDPVGETTTGSSPIFNDNTNTFLGGWAGVCVFTGDIYAAEIHDGIDGPTVNPLTMDAWTFNIGTAVLKGAPELWVSNAAWPGAAVDNFLATPTADYTRNYLPQIVMINLSHNSQRDSGNFYINKLKALVTQVRSTFGDIPKIIFLTQNPELRIPGVYDPGSQYQDTQATRRAQFMSWASNAGYGVIDTWSAFLADPRPLETLVGSNLVNYVPIKAISGNGTNVFVDVDDMSKLYDPSVLKVALFGLTLADGSPSHYNGAYQIAAKSSNPTGPGWLTFLSPITETAVITGASAAPSDGLHPSLAGYQLWADTVFAAFKRGTP